MKLLEDEALIEAVASDEHDQWIDWAVEVMDEVEPERKARWQRLYFVPYEALPDAVKEIDRQYARRALSTIQSYINEKSLTDG